MIAVNTRPDCVSTEQRKVVDILQQITLIAFQTQLVITALVDGLLCDFLLPKGHEWQPMASIVTMAPVVSRRSSSLGMAVISLDLASTLTWSGTKLFWCAKALTRWMAAF